jgi:O-glycosyl hydrolase
VRISLNSLLPVILIGAAAWFVPTAVQNEAAAEGQSVLPEDALLTKPVGGLERTRAAAQIVPVTGQPFSRALRITIRDNADDSNATQSTIPISAPVQRGDAMMAMFYLRGASSNGTAPAQMMFLFERSVNPWTKSIAQGALTARDSHAWKKVLIPFSAAENYQPGEAMVSLRFAFGPQTLEVGGLTVINYGKSRKADELIALAAQQNPLGETTVQVRLKETRQTLLGFGGNFCQPRYGSTEPMDAVGRYNLQNLRVVYARIGLPLNWWTPQRGVYREEAQARAALQQIQEFNRRKIPVIASIWEGPGWMLGGRPEQMGRALPPERYADCIEAIAQFLVTARDRYGSTVEYFSFNEPDYGVNFKFTPTQMASFIRQAGPRFQAAGLKTKFLVGDTANGANFVAYAKPLLEDRRIAPYLGPLAFHCWDALGVPDGTYSAIAELGRRHNKPVWCAEAGHDAQLWQAPNPWESWENGLRTALAYEKTLRLTGSTLMLYWTYQDNYPLVSKDGSRPFPVHHVIKQMEEALPPGAKIAAAAASHDELRALASVGPKPGQFSALLINPIGEGQTILRGLPPGETVRVVMSVGVAQRQSSTARTDRSGFLRLRLPARSVVTVLGSP